LTHLMKRKWAICSLQYCILKSVLKFYHCPKNSKFIFKLVHKENKFLKMIQSHSQKYISKSNERTNVHSHWPNRCHLPIIRSEKERVGLVWFGSVWFEQLSSRNTRFGSGNLNFFYFLWKLKILNKWFSPNQRDPKQLIICSTG
jgi:hypothetical protein